jgi:hypothetical protein
VGSTFGSGDRRGLRVGDPVEVHSAFANTWSRGFEIARIVEDGYQVRRTSDGRLLPAPTSEEDLRAERR